jgi:hypothetical protein
VLASDVLNDPIVGSGRSPDVVLGLQPIDRNHDVQMFQLRPTSCKRAKGAGHHLYVDSPSQQLRNHQLQFAIPNQGVASDDRKMQGTYAVYQFKYTVYEFLPFAIVQAAQSGPSTQMSVVVRITAWTLQWTFTGNFD